MDVHDHGVSSGGRFVDAAAFDMMTKLELREAGIGPDFEQTLVSTFGLRAAGPGNLRVYSRSNLQASLIRQGLRVAVPRSQIPPELQWVVPRDQLRAES